MAKVWKVLALLLVITALVWLTTMWRWQSAQVDPSPSDLALNLGVLPLGLTAALVITLVAVSRLKRYAASPAIKTAAATPSAHKAEGVDRLAANERGLYTLVLAASTQVRAGSAWSEAQASIGSGDCKPGLDANIKDDDGIAVFTAAMPDIDTAMVAESVAELIETLSAKKPEDWAGYEEASEEVLRALTLLELAAGTVTESVVAQLAALAAPPPSPRHRAAVLPPSIAIRVAIPQRWPARSREVASVWITQLFEPIVAAGLAAAGQSRAMAQAVRPAVQLHIHAVDKAEDFWLLIDQQLVAWQRESVPGLLCAAVADSLVSESETIAISTAGELFSGTNQRGRVPGEGGAAIVLATPDWPLVPGTEAPTARLSRGNLIQRDKSADAAGRISSETLKTATTGALQASRWQAQQVGCITTDADHRATRTAEVYEAVLELVPHLDAGEDALRLGLGCGDLGIARLLCCVALTVPHVQDTQQPAIVLGSFPAFERFAVVVAPAASSPPEATASALPPAPAQAA